jgi:hypothetical protein
MELTVKKEFIKLTDHQFSILNDIKNWVNFSKNTTAALSGAAGTGKSTLISFLIKHLENSNKICISAPTHKAKKVMEDMLKVKGTPVNSGTIQSLLGLKLDTDLTTFDPFNPAFAVLGLQTIYNYKLVIIDESSMINKDLFSMIKNITEKAKIKVLFVGDEYQLPPVKEDSCQCFKVTETHDVYNLTTIIRQENDNPVLNVLSALREEIGNKTYNLDRIKALLTTTEPTMRDCVTNKFNGQKGYLALNKEDFITYLRKSFLAYHLSDSLFDIKYIAWTNESVELLNKVIRTTLNNSKEPFVVGDIITGYSTVLFDEQIIITNSEEYKILNVEPIVVNAFNNVSSQRMDIETVVGTITEINVAIPDANYVDELKLLLAQGKHNRKWKQYYYFKANFLNPVTILNEKGKAFIRKDLDYGYGITIHKSQGSTYQCVFVSYYDIIRNQNIDEVFRLLYVAFSRTSKTLIILV